MAERVSIPGKRREGGRWERVRERREVVAGRVSLGNHLLALCLFVSFFGLFSFSVQFFLFWTAGGEGAQREREIPDGSEGAEIPT